MLKALSVFISLWSMPLGCESLCSGFPLFASLHISQSQTHKVCTIVLILFTMWEQRKSLYFGDHVIFIYKCWIDFSAYIWHRYNCNRYDEEEAKAARDAQERSRAALQRYLFYCNRYMNHMQSLKFEHKLYASVKEKMEEMQQHNMSWIEVITYFTITVGILVRLCLSLSFPTFQMEPRTPRSTSKRIPLQYKLIILWSL